MLICLRVRNFAIIDELEVEFGPGLNVLTGETGAGKSILVDALQLVLGARGRPEVVRTGAASAEVEAMFDLSRNPEVLARLEALDLAEGYELILRRVVQRNGRTRAYVNGRLTSIAQLAELAGDMADISSQHEHHTLVDAASHRSYLDAFGGLERLAGEMAEAHGRVAQADEALRALTRSTREQRQREDLLRFQLGEIRQLEPLVGEGEQLRDERDRQRHGERLAQLTCGGEDALYASDDALCGAVSRVAQQIDEAAGLDRNLAPIAEQLWTAHAQLEDAARELGAYGQNVSVDPQRLADIEDRLDGLSKLHRKYGDSVEAILEHARQAETELHALDHSQEHQEQLELERSVAMDRAATLARKLTKKRVKAAKKLGAVLQAELADLSMPDANVSVDVQPLPVREGGLAVSDAGLSMHGCDAVEFLLATNAGESPQPLRKIASGGELSRTMLAIKRALGGLGPGGLYVFDEVDAGVGGVVADSIGCKLAAVAAHHQVICITHLAQIAVFADEHFRVLKDVHQGRTRSEIVKLPASKRLEEVARMLGGRVTDKTRAAAREMLGGASRSRSGGGSGAGQRAA